MNGMKQVYAERINGRLVSFGKAAPTLLVVGQGKLPAGAKVAHHGEIVLRFGYPLLFYKDVIFPALVIDDFRRQFRGKSAIAFMVSKGNSYPRADVVGLRQSSQERAELFMKEVDIADGLRIYGFRDEQFAEPLARIQTVIWLDQDAGSGEVIGAVPGIDGSLLPEAAKCHRCAPSGLSEYLERISLATRS